jgi:2-hydroxycyclohexanecarboxyl-CoA dehydrogenase
MDLNLKDKVVIVTGAASNIGRGIALAMAREGAKVAIADVNIDGANKVAEECLAAGAPGAIATRTDVGDWASTQAMVADVEKALGPIDVLVNNAGWVVDRLFTDKPRAEWEREVQINLWGNINCTRAVLDGMIARQAGAVVSIASDAGRIGEFREGVYGACKAGVISLAKTLARENGKHGLRFNVVCPGTTLPPEEELTENSLWASDEMKGWLKQDMKERIAKAYPLRRVGKPEDIAAAVLFLASDQASFITGQTLSVSGGYSMV